MPILNVTPLRQSTKSEMIELREELLSSLEFYDKSRNYEMTYIVDRQIDFLQNEIDEL